MRYVEQNCVDISNLNTFFQQNCDRNDEISYGQALDWAHLNSLDIPQNIPIFLNMHARNCDDGSRKFTRYSFEAAIVECTRVGVEKNRFKNQDGPCTRSIASNVALERLRDLSPHLSEEQLVKLVLQKSMMQWKSLTDDEFIALMCPTAIVPN
jgi:hypothetical protein